MPADRSDVAERPPPTLRELFLGFLGIALSGFGGTLAFARRAIVERRRWLTDGEFTETLTATGWPSYGVVAATVVVVMTTELNPLRVLGAAGALGALKLV